jgi:hypothetical protein
VVPGAPEVPVWVVAVPTVMPVSPTEPAPRELSASASVSPSVVATASAPPPTSGPQAITTHDIPNIHVVTPMLVMCIRVSLAQGALSPGLRCGHDRGPRFTPWV